MNWMDIPLFAFLRWALKMSSLPGEPGSAGPCGRPAAQA